MTTGTLNQEEKMPLNKRAKKIKAAMEKQYVKKKGQIVFYASANKGTITGVKKLEKQKNKIYCRYG